MNERNELVVKHLQAIQSAISRMAGNSFLLKGWTVALASTLFVYTAKDTYREDARIYMIASWLPILAFGLLDMYYLWQERLYRQMYDRVRSGQMPPDFSMDTRQLPALDKPRFLTTGKSVSIWLFYLGLALLLGAITYALYAVTPINPASMHKME